MKTSKTATKSTKTTAVARGDKTDRPTDSSDLVFSVACARGECARRQQINLTTDTYGTTAAAINAAATLPFGADGDD